MKEINFQMRIILIKRQCKTGTGGEWVTRPEWAVVTESSQILPFSPISIHPETVGDLAYRQTALTRRHQTSFLPHRLRASFCMDEVSSFNAVPLKNLCIYAWARLWSHAAAVVGLFPST